MTHPHRRPGKPATARGVVPSRAAVPARPATRSVPKGGHPRPATGRVAPPPSRTQAKNNTPLLIGGAVGAVVLLGLVGFAMSGGGEKKRTSAPAEKITAPKGVVDVSALGRDGTRMCDEGLRIIKGSEGLMSKQTLSPSEKGKLKGDLQEAKKLIMDGMAKLSEANEKSGQTYDTSQYGSAAKLARMKLGELGN